jgi:hypothetical protein
LVFMRWVKKSASSFSLVSMLKERLTVIDIVASISERERGSAEVV